MRLRWPALEDLGLEDLGLEVKNFSGLWKNMKDAEGLGLWANQVLVVVAPWDNGGLNWARS